MVRATNAPAQLMYLSQAESVGAIHNNRVCVWNINTRFNNCRTDQHIAAFVIEIRHDLFEFSFTHLTMADGHASTGNNFNDFLGSILDGFDFVMQVVNLSAAQ